MDRYGFSTEETIKALLGLSTAWAKIGLLFQVKDEKEQIKESIENASKN